MCWENTDFDTIKSKTDTKNIKMKQIVKKMRILKKHLPAFDWSSTKFHSIQWMIANCEQNVTKIQKSGCTVFQKIDFRDEIQ